MYLLEDIPVRPVQDLERLLEAGLAQVPGLAGLVPPQHAHQPAHVHVLIVVKMAEPSSGRDNTCRYMVSNNPCPISC